MGITLRNIFENINGFHYLVIVSQNIVKYIIQFLKFNGFLNFCLKLFTDWKNLIEALIAFTNDLKESVNTDWKTHIAMRVSIRFFYFPVCKKFKTKSEKAVKL